MYRIVVVGAGAVGKSALTVRFVRGKFIERYDPTIEDSYRKQVALEGQSYMLDVMDTAGQEEYNSLRDQYIKMGEGFLIVYSIISPQTLEATTKLRTSILRMKAGQENFPVVLVGNKKDLEQERKVQTKEGQQQAEKFGCKFLEVSAKTNEGVEEAFMSLAGLIHRWKEEHPHKKSKSKSTCAIL